MSYTKYDYGKIKIGIASPEKIEEWSYGEVTKPETINYRTLRPEKDGLFCEKTFGTTKEWECSCGKFKGIRYKGVVCDKCSVEVSHFKVRRERVGHITLATPVVHIWFYRSVPSRLGLLLNMTVIQLRSVIYFEKYIVIDPGDVPDLAKMDLLSDDEYYEKREQHGDRFRAGIGGEALKEILIDLDLELESAELRQKIAKSRVVDRRKISRLSLIESFINSSNRPEWMILNIVPVIPPELRPMVQLDGGRFATSDLNDLYRRLINRNNRLKKLLSLKAPDIIVKNEKRMLQESVDALFDNSRRKRVVKSGNRSLKSLSDILKGKQGRFRQNLLGKRVDYSGRSVIVVGPDLKLHQCGLPRKMALELFKPFIMSKLMKQGLAHNVKSAKKMIDSQHPDVANILEMVVKNHPVILNRAPTLHRLGMQAFEPILIDENAIRLHPLVCTAYNADFDGDQMAVHVPLSSNSQIEAWTLMLSSYNLLDPANGYPIVRPSQDMILGAYNLTLIRDGFLGEGKYFSSREEIIRASEVGFVHLQAKILLKKEDDKGFLETSAGRVIFSDVLPKGEALIDRVIRDKDIKDIIFEVFKKYGFYQTAVMLDKMKDTCFDYSTIFSNTISVEDIIVPDDKQKTIEKAKQEVLEINNQYQNGIITNEERYQKTISLWTYISDKVGNDMISNLEKDQAGYNSLYIMANSGARGSKQQIRQLGALRGLMAKPSGEIIELPILSNFKEGLSVLEYFISTHGARKGLSDTALKTADAGYLTRKLVDISQDVTVAIDDCGTINGINLYSIKSGDEVIEKLSMRVEGRYTAEPILSPYTGEMILGEGQLIVEEICQIIDELDIETIRIRNVVTCDASRGICRKCYGLNLANRRMCNIGDAVGIVASQSIGQPGTQLTMRTFHVGGTATSEVKDPEFKLDVDSIILSRPKTLVQNKDNKFVIPRRGYMTLATIFGAYKVKDFKEITVKDQQKVNIGDVFGLNKNGEETKSPKIGYIVFSLDEKEFFHIGSSYEKALDVGGVFEKGEKEFIAKNEVIYTYDPYTEPIIVEKDGTIRYQDIIEGKTLRVEIDEYIGVANKKITEFREENLEPRLNIELKDGDSMQVDLPIGAILQVKDNQKVEVGDIVSNKIRTAQKTTDITGGLPRVQEIFEARHPLKATVIAEIEGEIQIGETIKSKKIVSVVNEFGDEIKHIIPINKLLLVRTGDIVKAGDPLCEGVLDPHDILRVNGEIELYRFVLRNIQEVYKKQGVDINDKHIGVIVRQMLRRVEIVDSGDTIYMKGDLVDKYKLRNENKNVLKEGGKPAIAKSVLLGLTKASLNTDSFISSASFQETTKVLTNAAIKNSYDELVGVKENVIIGNKIPAGTGKSDYEDVTVYRSVPGDLDFIAMTQEDISFSEE